MGLRLVLPQHARLLVAALPPSSETYRDRTWHSSHHNANGLRRQDGRAPIRKAGNPIARWALGLLGGRLAWQRGLQFLLLLLLLDLALQLLLGIHGRRQCLHLGLEGVALCRWDKSRRLGDPLESWKGQAGP